MGAGQHPDQSRPMSRTAAREPLNNSVRSAFQSEKPQIVWCDPSDSSRHALIVSLSGASCLRQSAPATKRRYGRGAQRSRCGFSGETLMGRAPDQVRGRLFPGDSLPIVMTIGLAHLEQPNHTR